jgi:hypothetical protein
MRPAQILMERFGFCMDLGSHAIDPKPPAAHQFSTGFSQVKLAKKANKAATRPPYSLNSHYSQ